ncbi:hypothetical protein AMK09_37630 [Streptomyces sp. CB02488]|nr:hypothetical protein AMK09_37630 [Streptomyces sp. CB02488]
MHSMTSILTRSATAPRAGWYEDEEQRDNDLGPMPDETEFHQLARFAGRQARRTLAEMDPGRTRQPVLRMTRPLTFTPTAPAGPVAGGQCSSCHGAGGTMIDTSSDGVTRQHWQSCTACGGTGAAR